MSRWLVGQVKSRVWALTVRHEVVDDVLVLSVSGRAGTGGSHQLADALSQAIGTGHRRILCNIEHLDYASSAGLLALNAAAQRLRQDGGELVVCGVTDPVRIALHLSGNPSNFSVADSRAAAMARFGT